MNKLILLVTIIPWLLYCFFQSKNNLIKLKENHYLMPNIKQVISIKNILLFILFIIFYYSNNKSIQIELVLSLLFSTINLFLCIYSYYENNDYNLEISIKDKLILLSLTIMISIIMLVSISIKSILITYIILFTTSILNIILLYVSNKIITIVRRMNNEIKQL
jgi:hypothetical protein